MNFRVRKYLLTSAVSIVLLSVYPGLAVGQEVQSPQLISSNQGGATALSDVSTLYVAPFEPDSGGFRRSIIDSLNESHRFEVVSSKQQADAIVEGAARSTGYGFWGEISVRSTKDNRLLWSGQATRRDGTNDGMAFNQLVARLRAASGSLH